MDQAFFKPGFDHFVDLLGHSGLIPQFDEVLRTFHDLPEIEHRYPNLSTNLASWLVGQGLLTWWQYWKLSDGKWKGFFMDDYKLLDDLETDQSHSFYLAEHVSTGVRVAIRVMPYRPGQSKIDYQVVHEFS